MAIDDRSRGILYDIQAARSNLQANMLQAIREFEQRFGVTVNSISLSQLKAMDRPAESMHVDIEVRL